MNGLTNSAGNTSLNDLSNASTVLNDLMEPYAGNNQQFAGSDHLPVVADYVVALVPGDFNNNGVVDAADYVVWREGLGTTYTQNDYNVWRSHFGAQIRKRRGVTALAAVPEPTALVLLVVAMAGWLIRPHRAAQKVSATC